jgi:ketosteroid isomerase-like protein
MFRYPLRLLPMLTLLLFLILPARARAQASSSAAATGAAAEVRAAIRRYDDALRRADVAAVEQFWAPEYTFVNPRGELVTRAARLANLRAGRTAFDSLAPAPQEEQVRTYGDKDIVAVHTTLLTLGGRYGGQSEQGRYRALAVWVRRGGRWQQVASQLTPILGP